MNMNHVLATKQNKSVLALVQACVAIVVLASVVVIFIGISSPRGNIEAQRRTQDMSNLRQIGIVMFNYAQDNKGVLPLHPRSINDYLGDNTELSDIYNNPYQASDEVIDRGRLDDPAMRFGGYIFLRLGDNLDELKRPSETILAYTARVSPDQTTRGVLFADGHAERWEEEKLRAALPEGVNVDALDGP